MKLRYALFVLLAMSGHAAAAQKAINLSTWPKKLPIWKVYEVSGGQLVSGTPSYIGQTQYGKVRGITVPFTDNDGFWYAQTSFTLPADATNPTLVVVKFGVDDRAVLQLNGVNITGVGTNSGAGEMQFSDPGTPVPFTFANVAGPVSVTSTAGFQAGENTLTVVVNNTDAGIYGGIQPITQGDPSNVGIQVYVTYDKP